MELILPWNEESVMSQRQRLIEQLLLPNANVSEVCKVFNISRKTAYKWITRYKSGGYSFLEDRKKEPLHQPKKTCSELEEVIVKLHQENPYW